MNQIYKVIWSRVKHCYVVVPEIVGRSGKNGGTVSEKKSMPVRAFLCALAVTGCLLPGIAEASFDGGIGASRLQRTASLSGMMPRQQRNIRSLSAADPGQ